MLQHRYAGLRLITFDLDDTLWPCHSTIMRAEEALFGWLQRRAPAVTQKYSLVSMREQRRQLAHSMQDRAHDLNHLRHRQLELILQEVGHDPSLAGAAVDYFQQHRNCVEPFEDVIRVLQQLRRDYLLVSLTNGTTEIDKTPLAGLFHHSINAVDAGHAKPHPAMFQAALQFAAAEPHESLHIGDDMQRDVEPAQALGMQVVHVERDAAKYTGSVTSGLRAGTILQIQSLFELIQ